MSTKQQRIAELAREAPQRRFTSLAYLMDLEWFHEAYRRTRKDGAAGVDGQTATEYEKDLEGNLQALLDHAPSGASRAPPLRRVHIPKGGSSNETRPIGIPTWEEKILQRAGAMLLEPIFEQDFHDCSSGFRAGRSAHQALETLWRQTMDHQGVWILEVDIQGFFDTLDQARLREVLHQRVWDGVLTRLIGKWLQAGVMEHGTGTFPKAGTPQGGVISPILSNLFLHVVLDDWFEREVKPRLRGQAYLIRFADDLVVGFTQEEDARRVMEVLPKRFGRYGLTIHPGKTRLGPFHQPPQRATGKGKEAGIAPGTFTLLGFTHYWGRSLRGFWVVKRKTATSRLSRAMRTMAHGCRLNRHRPLSEQQQPLSQKLRGHFADYGITGNASALSAFRTAVVRCWRKWRNRRNRERTLDWEAFNRLLKRFPLPQAKVIHSVYAHTANP